MERIAVYQLSSKFVNRREDVPENARQVVYYALAVGHHVGVMDCFSSILEIPIGEYSAWLEKLPACSGREKLAGVLKFGEIEINRSHVGELMPLVDSQRTFLAPWTPVLEQSLRTMIQEPAYYLMMKKLA
jgi:hydrogenase-4 component J